MLVLSSATIENSKAVNSIHEKAEAVFESPAKAVLADTTYRTTIITYDPKKDKLPAAPTDTIPDNKTQVFTQVEHAPGFPGGDEAFQQYLAKNIKYPTEAKKNKVEGRSVLTFVVEKDGSLSDIKVLRSLGSGTDEEAVRVVKNSPKWKPGIQNGRLVRVQYSVPINFSLGSKTAAAETRNSENGTVFTAVEHAPNFPGGDIAFGKFLARNIRYPEAARKAKVEGRVIASFIVEKDGSLSNVKIVRGIGMGADEEAVRVLELSPKWSPGVQNGKPVRVSYAIPISFSLAGDAKDKKTGSVPAGKVKDVTVIGYATPQLTDSDSYKTKIWPGSISDPLYVLDGKVIKKEVMTGLDPKSIERISVLKDASSTALYGREGANGVVVITTKKKASKVNFLNK
jgi:TonB family protein